MKRETLLAVMIIALTAITIAKLTDIWWVVTMLSAAIVYGALSPIIAARRLYFLAAAAPHTALLAALIAIPLASSIGLLPVYWWAIAIGVPLIYIVAYLIHRGLDPDVATSMFVALTASSSVIALNIVRERYSSSYSIWAYIVGDPLLVPLNEIAYTAAIAAAILALTVLSYREALCLGVDKDFAMLAGIRVRVYDVLIFGMLALATIAVIRVVGFVLEHVLILLPASIAMLFTESACMILAISLTLSSVASLVGLYISTQLGIAPAGAVGLVLLLAYLVGMGVRRVRRAV